MCHDPTTLTMCLSAHVWRCLHGLFRELLVRQGKTWARSASLNPQAPGGRVCPSAEATRLLRAADCALVNPRDTTVVLSSGKLHRVGDFYLWKYFTFQEKNRIL